MVERALNIPGAKIGNSPVSWLREHPRTVWFCSLCHKEMPKGSFCYERTVHVQRQEQGKPLTVQSRKYLCLSCADVMLNEELEKVGIIAIHGSGGYKLFKNT